MYVLGLFHFFLNVELDMCVEKGGRNILARGLLYAYPSLGMGTSVLRIGFGRGVPRFRISVKSDVFRGE
jgi:hypothetical protein